MRMDLEAPDSCRPGSRGRAPALRAERPAEGGSPLPSSRTSWKSCRLDPTIRLDVRYATANNLLGRPVYSEARAFLQRPAAEALVRVNRALKAKGYGLVVFDGYRPWSVTKAFWDATPADKKIFVANPKNGSRHNRGCAVDLSLYDLATGREADMGGAYDEMSARSYVTYEKGPKEAIARRELLARRDGERGLLRRTRRVVALRLQGLARVPDSGRAVRGAGRAEGRLQRGRQPAPGAGRGPDAHLRREDALLADVALGIRAPDARKGEDPRGLVLRVQHLLARRSTEERISTRPCISRRRGRAPRECPSGS